MKNNKKPISAHGKNQRIVLGIFSDLSRGSNVNDIRYYGGSINNGERCISIGRDCKLFYDIPWYVVDIRHAGALFKQSQGVRLGYGCLRSFNRALHGLIKRGMLAVIPPDIVSQGHCYDNRNDMCRSNYTVSGIGNFRFISIIPNAYGIDNDRSIGQAMRPGKCK